MGKYLGEKCPAGCPGGDLFGGGEDLLGGRGMSRGKSPGIAGEMPRGEMSRGEMSKGEMSRGNVLRRKCPRGEMC